MGKQGTLLGAQVLAHLFLIYVSFGFPMNQEVIDVIKTVIKSRNHVLPINRTWYDYAVENFQIQADMYKQQMTWQIVKRQLQNPDFYSNLEQLGICIKDGPKNS